MEVEQLLRRFEPEKGDQPLVYARSVVEYCSYIALCVETKRHDYLSDSEFHSLTYDMMIAWEAPDDETDAALQVMTPRFSFFFFFTPNSTSPSCLLFIRNSDQKPIRYNRKCHLASLTARMTTIVGPCSV